MRVGKEMEVTYKSGYVRFYREGDVHEIDPAECIMSFTLESPQVLIISGLFGKWSKERYQEAFGYFKGIGVKKVMAHCPTAFKPRGFVEWDDDSMMVLDMEDK